MSISSVWVKWRLHHYLKSVGQLNDSGWHGIPADGKASKSEVTKARPDSSIHFFMPVDAAGNS